MNPNPSKQFDGLSDQFDGFSRRDWQEAEAGTVRFAVVGVGWWTTEETLPAVADSDLCETTTLVSGRPGRVADVADRWDVDHVLDYEAFHDGEAADAYDAVYVCTPNATHLEHVRTAAGLGKAVLCEKPMEASVERAADLVAAAGDVPLMVAYRLHTEPVARLARSLVREGFVGEPVSVHGHKSQDLLEMIPDPDQWRLDPDLSGYGTTVMDIGIYPLNTTRFVLGEDPIAAQATMSSPDPGFEDVPDEHVAFTLEFPDHVYATCTASMRSTAKSFLRIVGTEGELRMEPAFFTDPSPTLYLARSGTTAEYSFEPVDQMREEFDYFADRVLTGREIHADGEHGLVDMRAIAAIYEAGETGGTVQVE